MFGYNPEDLSTKISIYASCPQKYASTLCNKYPSIFVNGDKFSISTFHEDNKPSLLFDEYFPILILGGESKDNIFIEKYVWFKIQNNTETPILNIEETHSSAQILRLFASVKSNHTLTSIKWVLADANNSTTEIDTTRFEIELNKSEIKSKQVARIYSYVQSVNSNNQSFTGEGFYEINDLSPKLNDSSKSFELIVTIHNKSILNSFKSYSYS